ncbi:unnamed protein product [Mycena citricolor]|uniref:Uncharacterized protein n=1 Tax=Mycena citricolor TaxID=2018698 RepID=A0AAD2HJT9_9AGAR|nr:unnamed protein product [Mycena citricolor]
MRSAGAARRMSRKSSSLRTCRPVRESASMFGLRAWNAANAAAGQSAGSRPGSMSQNTQSQNTHSILSDLSAGNAKWARSAPKPPEGSSGSSESSFASKVSESIWSCASVETLLSPGPGPGPSHAYLVVISACCKLAHAANARRHAHGDVSCSSTATSCAYGSRKCARTARPSITMTVFSSGAAPNVVIARVGGSCTTSARCTSSRHVAAGSCPMRPRRSTMMRTERHRAAVCSASAIPGARASSPPPTMPVISVIEMGIGAERCATRAATSGLATSRV